FEKTKKEAKVPVYAHPEDAGMDLFCVEDKTLGAGEQYRFELGVKAVIPEGQYISFRDKSGLASKGLLVLAGVIDSGYRGEWMVLLINLSSTPYQFMKGDKVAQALLLTVSNPEVTEGQVSDQTVRGEGGFGSTGK
ncbi:dUTP diphosphatase, partial [Patescibacteria group bacterium]|nr:dUTP diphosphatase [Patescibacteria group bacterium]